MSELLTSLDFHQIKRVTDCFLEARRNGNTVYFAGNGGSASTAAHFAQDLGEVGRKAGVACFRSLSLTDNVSLLTAVANDYGYDKIFTIPMQTLFNKGDVLVVISASGNSPNVVEATRLAHEKGGKTVALVGFDGGKLAQISDYLIHVKTPKGEYGPVEDLHMVMDHMITSYLILRLKQEKIP